MESSKIREIFLAFFREKGHQIVPSAPIVVQDDPTLMFTNAGMNQFKDVFIGTNPPPAPRVADTQKCLRVSGKHNDLEEVGHDTYHHTMFEMLGNWSFGDYFKAEAIAWAWELLTEQYGLEKERLYVTIFEGDVQDGTQKDEEAYTLWTKHIPSERILPGNKKDNFWEMGEVGPCGPCSEIHVDLRSEEERREVPGASLINKDHPLVVEIWNLVFIQYHRSADKQLHPLPKQHIDTGMGFERLCMALQGKTSNYDTDVFQPLIKQIEQLSGVVYGQEESGSTAIRVIADHIRAIAFTIADGQLPANNGAGYVIRRILRRAVRYGYTFLNFREPFLYRLVEVLVEQFKSIFPEIKAQADFVEKVIREEEAAFLRTLSAGIQRFDKYAREHGEITGTVAFELYDTFGFPIDLTQLLAREQGLPVDMPGYQRALEAQKNRSRQATTIQAGDWVTLKDAPQSFVGYDDLLIETQILQYRMVEQKGKKQYQLVLETTPFYAEGGGQVGDTGLLSIGEESIQVLDTRKENNLIIQWVSALPGDPTARVVAKVDTQRRFYTASNHTATHLMHAALREVLGEHVAQKGSLVSPDYLRFDFSHFSKMTDEEIREVELLVNAKIRADIPLEEERSIAIEQAKAMGATALFGEKYGDAVRMITFDPTFSRELCGGTHIPATGMLGFFKITSESAVQAGVRRIEAVTGVAALHYIFQLTDNFKALRSSLKNPKDVLSTVQNILEENTRLKKEVEQLTREKVLQLRDTLLEQAQEIDGVVYISARVTLQQADAVKQLAFALKQSGRPVYAVIGAVIQDKPLLTVIIADALVSQKGMDAGKIIRNLAQEIQGGGGGQAFYATAGGKNAAGLEAALAKAKSYIVE